MVGRVGGVDVPFLRDEGAKTALMAVVLLIATVLVATIMAAAVFSLNRDLADKSIGASDEAVKGIAAGLERVHVIGVRGDTGEIIRLNVTLRASYGASVALDTLVVQVTGGTTMRSLFPMNGTSGSALTVLRDQDGSMAPPLGRMKVGDLAIVTLDLEVLGFPMAAGDRLHLQVLPEEGHSTRLDLRAPEGFGEARLVPFE
ncbi:MAG: hypothetical protein KY455_12855 [Euryarchaeota archaeon]|nr:hypothetical protein [Euryarchaeota archaeon]